MTKINDRGIILSIKKYSENSLIVKILSQNHGIYSGFIRGALSSKKNYALYQSGNLVEFNWQSRIDENLGFFKIELVKSFLAEILFSPIKLSCFKNTLSIIEQNIYERDSQPELFGLLSELLYNFQQPHDIFLKEYIKFEIELLRTLGYGIDLSKCAATELTTDLHFVSPKSARAVSKIAGEKYRDKLLALPQFLIIENYQDMTKQDLVDGLKLSGFFINKHLSQSQESSISNARNNLIKLVNNL